MASGLSLAPDTTYWLVVEQLPDKRGITMLVTETADEDPGSASGWSLGDAGQKRSNGSWTPLTGAADTIQMAVLAMSANAPAAGAPVIVGAPKVNVPVLVKTAGITDPDGLTGVSYTYQWTVGAGNVRAVDIPRRHGGQLRPQVNRHGQAAAGAGLLPGRLRQPGAADHPSLLHRGRAGQQPGPTCVGRFRRHLRYSVLRLADKTGQFVHNGEPGRWLCPALVAVASTRVAGDRGNILRQ